MVLSDLKRISDYSINKNFQVSQYSVLNSPSENWEGTPKSKYKKTLNLQLKIKKGIMTGMVWTLSATSAAILFDRNLTERVTDVHAHASVCVRLKQK